MKWYIISRNNEPMIISVKEGKDPLYQRPGWTITGGPFDTVVEAGNFLWGDKVETTKS